MFNEINSPTARSIWQVGNRKARRERMMGVFLKGKKNIPFSSFLLRAIELCHEASLMSQIPIKYQHTNTLLFSTQSPSFCYYAKKKTNKHKHEEKKKAMRYIHDISELWGEVCAQMLIYRFTI